MMHGADRKQWLWRVDGEYLEFESSGKPMLTLIPPAMFGPPEKVGVDRQKTDKPGLFLNDFGQGRMAYVPWDIGGLYYRHSSEGHAGLVADLIDNLLPNGRQLRTNAHPLVEMTVMQQQARHRTLVHLDGRFTRWSAIGDYWDGVPATMKEIS
jgi:hypothetical protein